MPPMTGEIKHLKPFTAARIIPINARKSPVTATGIAHGQTSGNQLTRMARIPRTIATIPKVRDGVSLVVMITFC